MNLIAGVDGCSWCISIYVLKSFPRRGLVQLPLFPICCLVDCDFFLHSLFSGYGPCWIENIGRRSPLSGCHGLDSVFLYSSF